MAKMIKIRISDVTLGNETDTVNGIAGPNEEIVERPLTQQAGFHSIPRAGSVGIGLVEGEDVEIIATSDIDSNRPTIAVEGEAGIYNTDEKHVTIYDGFLWIKHGDSGIQLGTDSGVVISSQSNSITIEKNGDIKIGGAALNKLMTEAMITPYNTHVHTSASPGSPTSPPTVPLVVATHATLKTEAQ